jgi:hypothetical protein
MTLLLKFLERLLLEAPTIRSAIGEVIKKMFENGELTESQKEKLTRKIRPTRDKEIDARVDAAVAKRFPKDD